ncbi:hypothetical protein Tco_0410506 [Tanacetum coccineum]
MSNLKFAKTHNLVAFLEKPEESDVFEGIIDFLNASSIIYALMVNPTIYTSCIKQFWGLLQGKDCQMGNAKYKSLVMEMKTTDWNEFSSTMALAIISQERAKFKMPYCSPTNNPSINQPSSSQPLKKQKPRKTKKQNTEISQPSDPTQPMADETEDVESVPMHSNDPLSSW